MKYIGFIISSLSVVFIILINLYYNIITLDIKMIENYVLESNIIFDDLFKNNENVFKNKEEYINRLTRIKNGIQSAKTSFLTNDYKKYRVLSLENLENTIVKNNNKYLTKVDKYNKLSEKELNDLLIKNIFKVTNIKFKSYY